MLSILHRFQGRLVNVAATQLELRAPELGITRTRYDGCRFLDASSVPCRRGTEWAKLVVVLRGELGVCREGREEVARRGAVIVSPRWGEDRVIPLTPATDAVKISWRRGGCAGDAVARSEVASLGAVDLARLEEALHLEESEPAVALARARRAFALLESAGYAVRAEGLAEANARVQAADHLFVRAIRAVLFPLSRRPMLSDVARVIGVGERQAVRLSNEFFRRCFASVDSWRDFSSGWRLACGAMLLSGTSSRVEDVAAELGFSSPSALCHAFARAGWDTPLGVRDRLRAA